MRAVVWDGAGGRVRAGRRSRRHIRRADEPPVEADAGGVAANAPEGFGVGKGNGARGQAGGSGYGLRGAAADTRARTLVQEAAQMGKLGSGFFFRATGFPDGLIWMWFAVWTDKAV